MDTLDVVEGGKLELDTGTGNVSMGQNDGDASDNSVTVDGTADIFSGTGSIDLNKVSVGENGWLNIDTGSLTEAGVTDNINDVTADQLRVDGKINIKTQQGDLLMKDDGSAMVLGESFNEAESSFDIGGDIGAAELYFKTGYAEGTEKDSLSLNIPNVVNSFIAQLTDIPPSSPAETPWADWRGQTATLSMTRQSAFCPTRIFRCLFPSRVPRIWQSSLLKSWRRRISSA